MRDYGKASATMAGPVAAASSRRSRTTRLLDDGRVCATMDELNWDFEKPSRAVDCSFQLVESLRNYGSMCATMGQRNWKPGEPT